MTNEIEPHPISPLPFNKSEIQGIAQRWAGKKKKLQNIELQDNFDGHVFLFLHNGGQLFRSFRKLFCKGLTYLHTYAFFVQG